MDNANCQADLESFLRSGVLSANPDETNEKYVYWRTFSLDIKSR